MALVVAEYRFRVVHIGEYGRSGDGGVFAGSVLGRGLEAGTLNVPEYVVISHEALSWTGHLQGEAHLPLQTRGQEMLGRMPLAFSHQGGGSSRGESTSTRRKWMPLC